MFNTYYYRKNQQIHATLASPSESMVYKAVPIDELVSFKQINRTVLADKENDTIKSVKDTANVLEWLIKNGWVGEIHGVKIEKFLKTL